jgi:crotonobetainyl-CoA:carnitine CoA-transferase CaiB-like acyl-CoA transferase
MNTRLGGSQVLDLSIIVPGGTPSMILADLGADLINVESPTGSEGGSRSGPHRRPRVAVTRARRSMAVDITLPASRDVVLRLAAGSDVLLANFLGAKGGNLGIRRTDGPRTLGGQPAALPGLCVGEPVPAGR